MQMRACTGEDVQLKTSPDIRTLLQIHFNYGTNTPIATADLNTYLTAAINDEYKARNTYQAVISKFENVRPFTNIKKSEEQHIRQLIGLYNTYGIFGSAFARFSKVLELMEFTFR